MPAPSDASSPTPPSPDPAGYSVSSWERLHYYDNGGSKPAGELIYRSDLLINPLLSPPQNTPPYALPTRALLSLRNAQLDAVWGELYKPIAAALDRRGIRFMDALPATFSCCDAEGAEMAKRAVIWVRVRPNSVSAREAHDASLEILALLDKNGITGVPVEWQEVSE